LCLSRRSEFSYDAVDGTATIADYKHVLYYSVRGTGGDARHVQVDFLAAGAVGIDRVAARPTHSKIGQVTRPKAIGRVISLCVIAFTVKPPDNEVEIRDP
jgi:hypothetical protein